jgi:hypothetical protein
VQTPAILQGAAPAQQNTAGATPLYHGASCTYLARNHLSFPQLFLTWWCVLMGAAASVCDCRDCGSVRRRQALCGSGEAKRCVVLGGWAMCCVNCIVLAGSRPEGSMPSFPTFSVCCGHYRARGDGSCSAAAASCCKSEMVGALAYSCPLSGKSLAYAAITCPFQEAAAGCAWLSCLQLAPRCC